MLRIEQRYQPEQYYHCFIEGKIYYVIHQQQANQSKQLNAFTQILFRLLIETHTRVVLVYLLVTDYRSVFSMHHVC